MTRNEALGELFALRHKGAIAVVSSLKPSLIQGLQLWRLLQPIQEDSLQTSFLDGQRTLFRRSLSQHESEYSGLQTRNESAHSLLNTQDSFDRALLLLEDRDLLRYGLSGVGLRA